MSLSNAISAALSGLRLTQAGVGLVADNIANAETPGHVRKSILQSSSSSSAGGVQLLGVAREMDIFVQRQLRAELAGAAYAGTVDDFYVRIAQIYGQPGGLNALDTLYNNFSNSLRSLVTSPESIAMRTDVLNQASVLAQQLNAMSGDIQELRTQAEISISAGVTRVNEILQSIEKISAQLVSAQPNSAEVAGLLDARDSLVAELSKLMDVRVVELERGQISIFTNSGVSLFDHKAARLAFDGRDTIGPQSLWNADPDLRRVGTITLVAPNGYQLDLIADRAIRSGEIAAHLEMRDQVLVQAQAQIDEIAHALALALSNHTVTGDPSSSGAAAGLQLDLADLKDGNTITLTYTDNVGGQQQSVTIVRVDDAGALPLSSSFTADPDDTVIGVDFSGGMAAVVLALNTALGATGLVFDNPSGDVLRVLDDGVPDLVDVDEFTASITSSAFDVGELSLPFFVDGGSNSLYTNFVTATGQQKLGFASRIAVNPELKADSSRLVLYASNTQGGDPARPQFLDAQLSAAVRMYSPESGIGTDTQPYEGALNDFIRQAISMQGSAAQNAERLKEGQDIVVNALQERFSERASVNIDAEMARLLQLQTAYGANARVFTAVKEMIDMLMKI
jgi:flagellar hook-associated protein 1 FlgK